MAYRALLESIENNDFESLQDLCEKKLFTEFQDFNEELNFENYSTRLENCDNHDKIKIRLIDYNEIYGASIHRNINEKYEVQKVGYLSNMIPHLKVYMPKNYDDIVHLGINIELILRIESNLKLNLISNSPYK